MIARIIVWLMDTDPLGCLIVYAVWFLFLIILLIRALV